MANSDHQHTTPFDDRDRLPEELRRVAQRYAALPVPRPTSEETRELIARLQASSSAEPSYLPALSGEVARDVGIARPEGPDLSHLRIRPRQRGRRVMHFLEALAAVLVVGIVVGSFLLVLALRQHHSPAPSSGVTEQPVTSSVTNQLVTLQTFHMFDATNGWALTSTSVLYTTNGWSTWKNVTPHKAALVVGGYFLTGQEAWIAEGGQQPGAIVSRTTDGGQTWQSAALSAIVPLNPARMSFINNRDGWIEAEMGGSTGNDFEMIFRTTDGGKSWIPVSSTPYGGQSNIPATFPFTGHKTGLTFINATTGWATGPWLYMTHDGGATWKSQSLPTAPNQVFAPPTFFNARDGILPATFRLFVTHDGGATWQPTTLLPEPSNLVTAFPDMQHGLVAASSGTTLYSTSDGGEHWAKITPVFTARITGFAQLNFVSTEIGWALGYQPETANMLFFKTADGGRSWTQVPLATP